MCAYQRSWDQTSRDNWERQRLARDVASGNVQRNAKIDAFLAGGPKPKAPNKHYGPADFSYLLGPLNKEVADTVKNRNRHASNKNATSDRSKIAKAAAEGQTLYSATPSSCFSEVSWADGIATLSFANKTQMTIDVSMTLSEWLDFCSGSMGENWNRDWYGS